MTPEEMHRANAELVIEQLGPGSSIDFGLNAESVRWVDGFIERQRAREDAAPGLFEGLTQTLGSYLGECVIAVYGGAWREEEGTWAVAFDDRNAVYPFNKVRKQFENGPVDSISGFYETIEVAFAGKMKAGEPGRRPWWKRRQGS